MRSVLIADDSVIHRQLLHHLFVRAGFHVVGATDGFEAIDAFNQAFFDLVLLDCRMPGMDGYAAAKAMRLHEREAQPGRHTPIVALTSFGYESDRLRCLQIGMDDYLVKPIHAAVLDDLVARWTRRAA